MAVPPIPSRLYAYPCKVCGTAAPWLGAVDFSKWCSHDWRKTRPVGAPVDYYRCISCGLLFSPSFDGFTPEQWKTFVYNSEYLQIDPDYTGGRGEAMGNMFAQTFPAAANLHVIDYGCGRGTMAARLRELHWTNVTNYDPFVPEFSQRPTCKADLVVAVEVLEHSHNPVATFEEIASLRTDNGVIVATTLLAPPNADSSVLEWWYVAPRNGHVTIHTAKSLGLLASRAGLTIASNAGQNMHLFWRDRPQWAAHILPQ
jgi:2-polyprenyl-6-hydroxyphenyl methylase/3-demethylubiquinone-9 3-methyltransferase